MRLCTAIFQLHAVAARTPPTSFAVNKTTTVLPVETAKHLFPVGVCDRTVEFVGACRVPIQASWKSLVLQSHWTMLLLLNTGNIDMLLAYTYTT